MWIEETSPVSKPLPWHETLWQELLEQASTTRLPHALLLRGPQHTGKRELAYALSRWLLCREPRDAGNCGECHACHLSGVGNHGDWLWVAPQDSRFIKIDQVRNAVTFTQGTASFGSRKVIVIAPLDSLNINAFNALLKVLEEPPAETYFILTCHRQAIVPATVRSRCRLVHLPMPEESACLAWLDSYTGLRSESEQLLALADGQPVLARQLLQTKTGEALAARHAALDAVRAGELHPLAAAKLWQEIDVETFLAEFGAALQRMIRVSSLDVRTACSTRAGFALLDEVLRIQAALQAGSNPNGTLLVEAMLSKFHMQLGSAAASDTIA